MKSIEVDIPQGTANTIMYRIPETGLQGKFSMGYLIARALIDGKITLDSFTDEAVRDKHVLALVGKVEMKVDPALPPSTSADGSRAAKVTILMQDGTSHSRYEQFPKGSPQLPVTPEELKEKVRACAHGVISNDACERMITSISKLETMPSIKPLLELL